MAQIRQHDAVRMLVVPEQSIGGGRDHEGAAGDAWNQFHSTTFRCTRAGAGDLQVAQHQEDDDRDPGEYVPAAD